MEAWLRSTSIEVTGWGLSAEEGPHQTLARGGAQTPDANRIPTTESYGLADT